MSRRRRQPQPVLLPSLERLTGLIERVVELLDEVSLPSSRDPAPAAVLAPAAGLEPDPQPAAEGHVLLLSAPEGYRLLEREGAPPVRGALLEVEEAAYRALRLGPSPLPGDTRRCAYLEREEPPKADRTFDR